MVAAIERQVRALRDAGRRGSPTSAGTRARSPTPACTTSPSYHDQILVPVILKHWRIEQLQNLKAAAEQARERLLHHMERMNTAAKRLLARRARAHRPRDLTARRRGLSPCGRRRSVRAADARAACALFGA